MGKSEARDGNSYSRRSALAALGVAAGGLAVPRVGIAALQCQDNPMGRICEAGIPSTLAHVAARKNSQYQDQWCWAACISMVFAYYGHRVDQGTIVETAYGGQVNMPAQPWTILSMLNRTWTDGDGDGFRSAASAGVSDPSVAARDLQGGMPLIIGTMGHAVVLTSLVYAAPWIGPGRLGPVNVQAAKVRDPWPGRGLRTLSPQEWYGIQFVSRIRVS